MKTLIRLGNFSGITLFQWKKCLLIHSFFHFSAVQEPNDSRQLNLDKQQKFPIAAAEIELNTNQRETIEMRSNYHQLHPFSKWGLLLMERICSQGELILSFKSSSSLNGKMVSVLVSGFISCTYL